MRAAKTFLLLPLAIVAAACSGSGGGSTGPTAPAAAPVTLQTSYGTATVLTNGNGFDAGRARASIEQGYLRARAQVGSRIDGIGVNGLTISVRPGPFDGAVGEYHHRDDVIEMAFNVEEVLEHELQHRFCHALGNSGTCCTLQDHAPGFDLTCSPS